MKIIKVVHPTVSSIRVEFFPKEVIHAVACIKKQFVYLVERVFAQVFVRLRVGERGGQDV